jgi:hypothetical protein
MVPSYVTPTPQIEGVSSVQHESVFDTDTTPTHIVTFNHVYFLKIIQVSMCRFRVRYLFLCVCFISNKQSISNPKKKVVNFYKLVCTDSIKSYIYRMMDLLVFLPP